MQQQYGLSIVTAATTTPITLEEALAQLRVDSTTEAVYIRGLVRKAVRYIESISDRTLITTVRRLTLDEFPCSDEPLDMPRSPLISSTAITYVDSTGGNTTMASSDYIVDTYRMPGRISPAYGAVWPFAREQMAAVNITYTCGYGASSDVPETDKHAIALMLSHWFRNREPISAGVVNELPFSLQTLLSAEDVGRYP